MGIEIIEFDYATGIEKQVPNFPTPEELWGRYRSANGLEDQGTANRLLMAFNREVRQGERYYQQIAINRSVEAILKGQRRVLLSMATGTGKTLTCH